MVNKSLKFFIAEDEALILQNFYKKIEKMGHQIVGVAMNGNDAETLIRKLEPDMLLMDINLPEKDGLSVIESICSERMIPSVIITGYYSTKMIEKAMRSGVFAYLMKPIDGVQLEAAINIAWSKYQEYIKQKGENEQLKITLENRKTVEKAKGILMDRFALKEADAMKHLQKMSKDKNKKIAVIAEEIIEANKLLQI